jgi:hypothetical protein
MSKETSVFDMTRWYHLHCFPSYSKFISVENINGFMLLKAFDHEALKSRAIEFGKICGLI